MKAAISALVVVVLGVVIYFVIRHPQPVIAPIDDGKVATTTAEDVSNPGTVSATPASVSAYVDGSNRFGFDLYSRYTSTQAGKNIFFSPYSIVSALGMTYEGAEGATAVEMQNVLHMPTATTSRRTAAAALYDSINAPGQSFTLKTANALWVEKTYDLLRSFLSVVSTYYKGSATNLDFKNAAEPSRNTINSWVSNQTNGKITDLLPPGSIDSLTRLVLTNAVYFKGTWLTPFNKNQTQPANFYVSQGKTVTSPLMSLSHSRFSYGETPDAQLLDMPYSGNRLSMFIILPKNNSPLSSVEPGLNSASLKDLKQKMSKQEVNIFIPKFTFRTTYGLAGDLSAMGMRSAFLPAVSDFSGMSGTKDLYISQVVHQAYVAVDEVGTEAAAASGVGMASMAMPVNPVVIPVFRADHPFVFFIVDDQTGEILFMGRMIDPTTA